MRIFIAIETKLFKVIANTAVLQEDGRSCFVIKSYVNIAMNNFIPLCSVERKEALGQGRGEMELCKDGNYDGKSYYCGIPQIGNPKI